MMHHIVWFIFVLQVIVQQSRCYDQRLTIIVEPLQQDCFYQPLTLKEKLEIDYQVIGGGHGDLDISFSLSEPSGRIVLADFKKSEKSHDVTVQQSGDYKFCFDNTFSSFNSKTVYFEMDVIALSSEASDLIEDNPDRDQEMIDFFRATDVVLSHLNDARQLQDIIKATEAKDRNVAEEACFRVNTYSMFVLCVMMGICIIQILMIKSIFDNKSQIYRVFCFFD